jgi:vancomycin resistance protein YoaR
MKKKKVFIIFLIIILIAIIVGFGVYGYYTVLNTELFYEGIIVDGMDIGLMTKEEALNIIKEKNEKRLDGKNMKIYWEDKEYNINLRELGYYYDYNKAIDEAYSIGREGNIINRVKEIISVKRDGVVIPLETHYDRDKINIIVENIAEEINIDMVDAQFNFNSGNIKVSDDVIGKKVKEEELIELINKNIENLNPIEIPIEKIMPNRTREQLSRINGIIGEFSSSFKGSSKGRIENIRLSSKALSKGVIMPGDTVSFNELTGPRSKSAGYQEANVIIKGEFVSDTGMSNFYHTL